MHFHWWLVQVKIYLERNKIRAIEQKEIIFDFLIRKSYAIHITNKQQEKKNKMKASPCEVVKCWLSRKTLVFRCDRLATTRLVKLGTYIISSVVGRIPPMYTYPYVGHYYQKPIACFCEPQTPIFPNICIKTTTKSGQPNCVVFCYHSIIIVLITRKWK